MSHVFISYDRDDAEFADALRSMLKIETFDTWMDTESVHAGQPWRTEIDQAISNALALVVVISPAAAESEYVTYEWSYALGAGVPVIPVIHKLTRLHPRLETLHHIDPATERHWAANLSQELKRHAQSYHSQLRAIVQSVRDAATQLEHDEQVAHNSVFREIVAKSLGDTSARLRDLGSTATHSLPAEEYPRYLIDVQRNVRAQVKALALVDQQEQFWQQRAGREIMETAQPNSQRVFVFRTPEQFDEAFEAMRKYASRYDVYAMSYDQLTRSFGGYAKDFSIIVAPGGKILAEYGDDDPLLKTIRFSADPKYVSLHAEVFESVRDLAEQISADDSELELATKRALVFDLARKRGTPRLAKKEMSVYIDIEAYDEYEEYHAYYQDMMGRMLKLCSDRRGGDPQPCRVLELGAGTGIFTKRVAKLPAISECVALEIDFECFYKLQHKLLKDYPAVHPVCEDCLRYEPDGEFAFVFSSFADHHIKLADRDAYLTMVRRALAPGGHFIVGDEFLPEHDPRNTDEWSRALRTYHGHIIEVARRAAADERKLATAAKSAAERDQHLTNAKSYRELVKLESDALQSGLDQKGDFKISCAQYEQTLTAAGLVFERHKIGPLQRDDLGGIYVYDIWIREDAAR